MCKNIWFADCLKIRGRCCGFGVDFTNMSSGSDKVCVCECVSHRTMCAPGDAKNAQNAGEG